VGWERKKRNKLELVRVRRGDGDEVDHSKPTVQRVGMGMLRFSVAQGSVIVDARGVLCFPSPNSTDGSIQVPFRCSPH
jgi:hypothetical protein